jgi:hypothetical protein
MLAGPGCFSEPGELLDVDRRCFVLGRSAIGVQLAQFGEDAKRDSAVEPAAECCRALVFELLVAEHFATDRLHDIGDRLVGAQRGGHLAADIGLESREVMGEQLVERLAVAIAGAADGLMLVFGLRGFELEWHRIPRRRVRAELRGGV